MFLFLRSDSADTYCFYFSGRAQLPSISDDIGLDDDADRGSEVTSGSQGIDSGVGTAGPGSADGGSVTSKLGDNRGSEDHPINFGLGNVDPEDPLSPDQSESYDPPEIIDMMQGSMTTDDEYTNIEIGDVSDDRGISQSSSMDTLSEVRASPKLDKVRVGASQDCLSLQSGNDALSQDLDISESVPSALPINSTIREGDVGSLLGDDPPLLYCARALCSKFLLTGYRHGLVADRQVRVSIKTLALSCTGCIVTIQPTVLLENLHRSSPIPGQYKHHTYHI